jgi:hypothetical protein
MRNVCPPRLLAAEIPPEKEAIVFEEIATMDFPFEGIPTVPPRKDMDHMAFFCNGCRWEPPGARVSGSASAVTPRAGLRVRFQPKPAPGLRLQVPGHRLSRLDGGAREAGAV